jgi:hypothetical protein
MNRRSLVTAGVAVLALGLGWVIYETATSGSDVPPPQPAGLTRLQGGTAGGKRIDGRSWSLDYRTATMTPDGQTAEIEDVRDGIIRRNGKPYLRMRAQHVSANITGNDFTATGPVVLTEITGSRRRLETVGAHFVGSRDALVLDNQTTITAAGGLRVVVDHAMVNFATGETRLGRIRGTM